MQCMQSVAGFRQLRPRKLGEAATPSASPEAAVPKLPAAASVLLGRWLCDVLSLPLLSLLRVLMYSLGWASRLCRVLGSVCKGMLCEACCG